MKSHPFARVLRVNSTQAEKLFWTKVQNRQFEGLKFRRQVPFGKYILDFVCFELKLVVEIDGGQHNDNPSDRLRDQLLSGQDF